MWRRVTLGDWTTAGPFSFCLSVFLNFPQRVSHLCIGVIFRKQASLGAGGRPGGGMHQTPVVQVQPFREASGLGWGKGCTREWVSEGSTTTRYLQKPAAPSLGRAVSSRTTLAEGRSLSG